MRRKQVVRGRPNARSRVVRSRSNPVSKAAVASTHNSYALRDRSDIAHRLARVRTTLSPMREGNTLPNCFDDAGAFVPEDIGNGTGQ